MQSHLVWKWFVPGSVQRFTFKVLQDELIWNYFGNYYCSYSRQHGLALFNWFNCVLTILQNRISWVQLKYLVFVFLHVLLAKRCFNFKSMQNGPGRKDCSSYSSLMKICISMAHIVYHESFSNLKIFPSNMLWNILRREGNFI